MFNWCEVTSAKSQRWSSGRHWHCFGAYFSAKNHSLILCNSNLKVCNLLHQLGFLKFNNFVCKCCFNYICIMNNNSIQAKAKKDNQHVDMFTGTTRYTWKIFQVFLGCLKYLIMILFKGSWMCVPKRFFSSLWKFARLRRFKYCG